MTSAKYVVGTSLSKDIIFFMVLWYLGTNGGISVVCEYLWLPLEDDVHTQITTAAYNKIMNLSGEFRDDRYSSHLWESVNKGLSIIYVFRTLVFKTIPTTLDFALALCAVYYVFDVYMALLIAAIALVSLQLSKAIFVKLRREQKRSIADINSERDILRESTLKLGAVILFNRTAYEMARYRAASMRRAASSFRFFIWSNVEYASLSILLAGGLLCALSVAAHKVALGERPVGSFVMLLSIFTQMSTLLQGITSGICTVSLHITDATGLAKLLRNKSIIGERAGARPLVADKGMVQLKRVKFGYDSRKRPLKKITFQALPGQTVALVSRPGEGKSTIINLIQRLRGPFQGSITIDGQNISDVTLESLRSIIGVVPQETVLFNDTILNNIRYANASASDQQIYEACKTVGLHEKLNTFADAYQTFVGEKGVKVPLGIMRQIAIVRVMIKNPKIVLLDEPAHGVDVDSDIQIQHGLDKFCRGRTTLIAT